MFGWWKRRRLRRGRAIYRYWDGSRIRYLDPVDAFLKLNGHETFEPSIHCKLVDENDEEAIRITTAAVREIFEVQPYDERTGTGLTVGEQLGLLVDFYTYLEEQKKSSPLSQTSPSNTEESTSETSSEPTTSCSSDSGPTSNEPTSEEATVSG